MGSSSRDRILDAALACFLADGYERTTTARIRERCGVSNGSLFHHFATKQAIAEGLYVRGIASFQTGLWEVLERAPESVAEAIHGTVAHQLQWIESHPDEARFIYRFDHLDWESPGGSEMAALNARMVGAVREWMEPFVARGEIRASSISVITAIVSGPGHALARRWLAGQIERPLTSFTDELAAAATAALQAPIHAKETR